MYIAFNVNAQQFKVNLTERVQDDKISKSLAILPVYKFQSSVIEPFSMFGIEDKNKEELKPLQIKQLPDMKGFKDTGYTYIYFSGANNEENQGYCLTLIGNYTRTVRTVYFFIDRNNNLDFTDDGMPDSMTYMDETVDISLKNTINPEAEHHLKLTRVQYGQNLAYKKLLTEHFTKHQGNKIFTDINYCFREQRMNTIAGTYRSETDSFVLSLKDMNNDGLFNQPCTDKFYCGGVGDEILTEEMNFVLPNSSEMYFEWNRKRYHILGIDPAGKFIELEVAKEQELTKQLAVGKKIPKFTFVNTQYEKEEIKKYKKKPVYIFFWDRTNLSDDDTLYLGKLEREFGDKIQIVALNHGDKPREVLKDQYYRLYRWHIGFSSYSLGKIFYIESLNRGYLLKKRLKLTNDDISPKEVYELVSTWK
ncbi:MAG: hypothetical protein H6607_06155 [Flavobacteriales bacterium]|nr:hypothetical protein [Flavobacteriales bacterium]